MCSSDTSTPRLFIPPLRQWALRIPALSQDSSAPQQAAVTLLYSKQGNEGKSSLSTIPAI